ncbi:carboxymuconolactone decarboxylase family protein [Cryptosporangium sp. NPDC051539]|uniref:carboxymuconolactone decarboxylase family protein n=1 Tax=Cryptosporangium sp. NPDC051539 TaxID=3363962 RepID=UPI0037B13A21
MATEDEIKAQFTAVHGEWPEYWETVLAIDPDFVAAYTAMAEVPVRKGLLTEKFRALVRLAVDSAATHLDAGGVAGHVRRALDLGATPAEVLEVLELTATVGIHAMNIGVPLLVEVLEERGRTGPAPLTEHQEELKAWFTRERGYWHDFWNEMLELDPEMFEAYTRFSTTPWKTGPLTPAEKELIYISYDIAATHLYVPGTKLHIRNALNHGASVGEILEVMELSSLIGIKSVAVAAPVLAEELAKRT